jgi:formylglycine-generating enzyme required for sulfatase activity
VYKRQYLACVKAQACKPPQWQEANAPSYYKAMGDALTGENFPVVGVSWLDAKSYVVWLNKAKLDGKYSLLSEAQWEYAARADSNGKWSFGDDEAKLKDYAWYKDNSSKKTHVVGGLLANAWNLHDMYGNVWEWVEDCYQASYQNATTDGSAWLSSCRQDGARVLRGGSWDFSAANSRSAIRGYGRPDYRYFNVGFRVARLLP